MRSTFAVAVSLLVGSAAATLAAPKHPAPRAEAPTEAPTYETCQSRAVQRALPPNQGPSTQFDAPFKSFMRECLAGKIPFNDSAAPVASVSR